MAKVLLINPPMLTGDGKYIDGYQGVRPRLPALGLAYIAAVLEKHGHNVRIVEGMAEIFSLDEVARITESFDIVGITSVTFLALLTHGVAKAIRERNKNIPIIVGGPHASVVPEEILEDNNIDYVVIGEGEDTFLELVEALEAKRPVAAIRGIAYRRENGIAINEDRGVRNNIDEIPLPARHLLPMHLFRSSEVRTERHPALHMVSSRGCPFNCSFCNNKIIYRCKLRAHSPQRVIEEMSVLAKDYKAKEVHLWDDCFVYDENRVYEICKLLRNNKDKLPWDCEATINRVNFELLKEMRSAGCFSVSYGIETGNNDRLRKLNKGWLNLDKIRQAVKWTRKAGLKVRAYFMFGFVGETLQEMEETIEFAKELDLDFATFSLLVPLPGTDDYEKAKREGEFDHDYWKHSILSEISFPLDPVYVPAGIAKKQLLEIHRRACREFYFRPKIIIKRAGNLKSISNLVGSIKGAFRILQK